MRSISFIIPVHNEEKRLSKTFKALQQVQGQLPHGLKLAEIIFVDNGSTDKTFLKLADFARENGNINISIISYKTKLPAKKVFLEGLKASKSHYTILLNKDLSNLKQELNKLKIKKVPNKNSLAQEENIEKLIKNYNKPESLLVISSYPKKQETYSNGVCAVASFTKNTISSLSKIQKFKKIIVLTMVLDKEEVYEENGILVVRCFRRNNPFSYFDLFKKIRLFNVTRKVLIEFEFASFGDTKATLAILPLVWSLYFLRKDVTIVVHQVVLDLNKLGGHIGISSRKILSYIFNPALMLYYRLLSYPAKNIVVLEEDLRERISTIVRPEKVHFVPHGVPKVQMHNLKKRAARKLLGIEDEIIILYFGYLTWYKGVDFLIRTFIGKKRLNGKKIKLIIAGGPSFTQEKKPHYKKFITTIQNMMKKAPSNVKFTGFVEEKDIPLYFSASDLVVLPYRAFISSSGPLSFALAFNKPFLLSEALGDILHSRDIEESIKKIGLTKKDLLFRLNQKSLIKKIRLSLERRQYKKLKELSTLLANKRSFKKLAASYDKVLTTEPVKTKRFFFIPILNYRIYV